jgi:hypothetical protein
MEGLNYFGLGQRLAISGTGRFAFLIQTLAVAADASYRNTSGGLPRRTWPTVS